MPCPDTSLVTVPVGPTGGRRSIPSRPRCTDTLGPQTVNPTIDSSLRSQTPKWDDRSIEQNTYDNLLRSKDLVPFPKIMDSVSFVVLEVRT